MLGFNTVSSSCQAQTALYTARQHQSSPACQPTGYEWGLMYIALHMTDLLRTGELVVVFSCCWLLCAALQ